VAHDFSLPEVTPPIHASVDGTDSGRLEISELTTLGDVISRRTIAHLQYEMMQAALDAPTYYRLDGGAWVATTNQELLDASTAVAMGLWSLGVRRGDLVAVMAESSQDWAICDAGALDIGAVVVSIYPTSTADATAYILQHSRARVLFIDNAEHWHRLGEVIPLPGLETVVVFDPTDMPAGDWISLETLTQRGLQLLSQQPELPAAARDAVQPDDVASLMYTSGTTGNPKGVPLTHEMLFSVIETIDGVLGLRAGDSGVVYLPMSHILQRVNLYVGRFVGMVGYFAPAITDLVPTCQAAHPRSVSGVPRVYEKIHAAITAGVAQAPPARQKLFARAIDIGVRRTRLIESGRRVPPTIALQHRLFEALVYAKLRAGIFGKNIEYATSGAAPISVELTEFFYAIGLPIYEGYGLTETSSPITLNLPEAHRIGSVGRALPGSEIKIGEDGEVLLRGPAVFDGYYDDPQATSAAMTEDGWFMSGDIGVLDADGYLTITDRKKSLIITAAGKNIAPAPIEQKLMQHPLIGQVVVHGDRRKYLTALFTLDPDGLRAWAASKGTPADPDAAASDAQVIAELESFVASVNGDLARFETIKQFRVLPTDFTVDNELLTPSMKIKRRAVEARFGSLLDEMYVDS